MMLRRFSFAVALLGTCVFLPWNGQKVFAQELQCEVTIDRSLLQGPDFEHLQDLKDTLERYFNERSWTSDRFRPEERIECQFDLTFREANTSGVDLYTAQLTVGSGRPIYGSPTRTSMLQVADVDWQFVYEPNQAILFDPERFDPLASVLDFYAYLILGYDYDSFFNLGGTPYFERARRIAELAQAQSANGWSQVNERSRGALIAQLLDPRMQPVREAFFDYYHGGLDHFVTDPLAARRSALTALQAIEEVFNDVSNQYLVDLFFSTKYQELVNVFDDSPQASDAYGVLLGIDPSRSSSYDRLIE
ncbi:MAG: DUF4835 family protein [Bacteroidota bacterium]